MDEEERERSSVRWAEEDEENGGVVSTGCMMGRWALSGWFACFVLCFVLDGFTMHTVAPRDVRGTTGGMEGAATGAGAWAGAGAGAGGDWKNGGAEGGEGGDGETEEECEDEGEGEWVRTVSQKVRGVAMVKVGRR